MISHTATAVVSRRCRDLTAVGGAAATFLVGGSRLKVLAWSAGGNLMQFDADAYMLARMVEEITHTYTDEVPPPDNIFIFSNSASALQAVQNTRSIKAHSSALHFHCALTIFTLCHSHVSFYLVWSPVDGDLEGFQMASTWAAATCLHDPPPPIGSNRLHFRKTEHVHELSLIGKQISIGNAASVTSGPQSPATPQTGTHIYSSSKKPPLHIITHSGRLLRPWRKMHKARKPNTCATPVVPHPLPSS
jgi:hypothetical protein